MEDNQVCGVCAEERSSWAEGKCGHQICAYCAHRMRFLYRDKNCAFCKKTLDVVRVGTKQSRSPQWLLDEESQIEFSTKKLFDHFIQLRRPQCPSCRQSFPSVQSVKDHLRHVHKRHFCEICLHNRKVFLVEQSFFIDISGAPSRQAQATATKTMSIKVHLAEAHTHCDFCRKHFYDEVALFDHLTKEHFACSVCEGQGKSYQYFKNFALLERHYKADHFMCDEPQCRGVVYGNEIDLKVHIRQVHSGETSRSDRARQLTINLAELHGAAVAAAASSGSVAGRRRDRNASNADMSRRRQNFSSQSVVYRQERATGGAPSGRDATSSSDAQSSQMTASISSTPARYEPKEPPESPDEARERNRALVSSLRRQMDPASFQVFTDASGQFREGERSAKEFFDFCVDSLGSAGSLQVLPELIALLPEPHLRASLTDVVVQVHGIAPSQANVGAQAATAATQFPALGSVTGGLLVGGPWSATQPSDSNTEADFPSLGNPAEVNAPNQASWRRAEHSRTERVVSAAREAPAINVQSDFPTLGGRSAGISEAADPSERAGAVWSGAGRQGKPKQRRRPPSPSPVGPPANSFPELGKSSANQGSGANTSQASGSGSGSPATAASGSASSSVPRGKVLDIGSLAAEHRKKVKNVPKIGSNGLPWEKKKARANIQAAKSDLLEKEKKQRDGPSRS